MDPGIRSVLAADLLLVGHVLFVLFVVLGFALILAGKAFRWRWVRNPWYRLAHLGAIGVVALQSWAGVVCPLTTWEMELRQKSGSTVYEGSFIQHWLHIILYYEAPEWMFIVCYTLFGILVIAAWIMVPPKRGK